MLCIYLRLLSDYILFTISVCRILTSEVDPRTEKFRIVTVFVKLTSYSESESESSESDVYRRQILTYKDGPRAERVNDPCISKDIESLKQNVFGQCSGIMSI